MRVALKSTVSVASLLAFVLTVLLVRDVLIHKEGERDSGIEEMYFPRGNRTVITYRKLLKSTGMRTLYLL